MACFKPSWLGLGPELGFGLSGKNCLKWQKLSSEIFPSWGVVADTPEISSDVDGGTELFCQACTDTEGRTSIGVIGITMRFETKYNCMIQGWEYKYILAVIKQMAETQYVDAN